MPLVRFVGLAIRQIGKPLAGIVKHQASKDPHFRSSIIGLAQNFQLINTRMHRQLHWHHGDEKIEPLRGDHAVQVAADVIGESVVFLVGSVAVALEVSRGSMAEARKEAAKEKRYEALEDKVRVLEGKVGELEAMQEQQKSIY